METLCFVAQFISTFEVNRVDAAYMGRQHQKEPVPGDYAPRQLDTVSLVELEVPSDRDPGIALRSFQLITCFQFPVMRQYEADTWYDQNGRIVFSSKRETGGFPRNAQPKKDEPIGWNDIKDTLKPGETIQRTITDNTLPTGPIERTITYEAPFTKCDREKPYEKVWAILD